MFEEVADDALRICTIKGNPLPLNQQRLLTILQQVCSVKLSLSNIKFSE